LELDQLKNVGNTLTLCALTKNTRVLGWLPQCLRLRQITRRPKARSFPWKALLRGNPENYYPTDEERVEIDVFFRDEFMPTLIGMVDLGLEVIRYEGKPSWLGSIVDVLIESFAVSCEISRLQTRSNFGQLSLPFSRPAYEIYLAARVLATYAVLRQRSDYLKEILPHYVHPLASATKAARFIGADPFLAVRKAVGITRDEKWPQ
jgi:hypothetical protein